MRRLRGGLRFTQRRPRRLVKHLEKRPVVHVTERRENAFAVQLDALDFLDEIPRIPTCPALSPVPKKTR